MKTVTHLKAGLVSRAAIEPMLEHSSSDKKESKEESRMEFLNRWYLKARERVARFQRGQDMTEYALIVAAIAIVVFAAYEIMGQSISTLASGVDSTLSNA